jgi:hypothetical protein
MYSNQRSSDALHYEFSALLVLNSKFFAPNQSALVKVSGDYHLYCAFLLNLYFCFGFQVTIGLLVAIAQKLSVALLRLCCCHVVSWVKLDCGCS